MIRRGEPADLDAVAAIQAASPEAAQWPPAGYLGYDLLVALCGGRLTGFIVSRQVAADEREILNVAVAPGFRRRGFARALVRSFLDGFQGIVFLEVRASNAGARALYKSFGFEDVTLRKEYYDFPPEDGVVMKFRSC